MLSVEQLGVSLFCLLVLWARRGALILYISWSQSSIHTYAGHRHELQLGPWSWVPWSCLISIYWSVESLNNLYLSRPDIAALGCQIYYIILCERFVAGYSKTSKACCDYWHILQYRVVLAMSYSSSIRLIRAAQPINAIVLTSAYMPPSQYAHGIANNQAIMESILAMRQT